MASRTVIEEDVTKLSAYRPIKALAEKKVSDDGTVEVTAQVSMLGITFSLEEVAILINELPRVVERANSLAARLKLDRVVVSLPPYEPPKATPVGNLNDRLAEVCVDHEPEPVAAPEAPTESDDVAVDVVVIVSGVDVVVVAKRSDPLSYVRDVALARTGNTGRALESWELRNENGFTLPFEKLVRDLGWKPRLFLGPRAGIGGSVAANPLNPMPGIVADVIKEVLDEPGKET